MTTCWALFFICFLPLIHLGYVSCLSFGQTTWGVFVLNVNCLCLLIINVPTSARHTVPFYIVQCSQQCVKIIQWSRFQLTSGPGDHTDDGKWIWGSRYRTEMINCDDMVSDFGTEKQTLKAYYYSISSFPVVFNYTAISDPYRLHYIALHTHLAS